MYMLAGLDAGLGRQPLGTGLGIGLGTGLGIGLDAGSRLMPVLILFFLYLNYIIIVI